MRVPLDGKLLDYRALLIFVGIGERSLDRPAPGSRRPGGARVPHVSVFYEPSRLRMAALAARVLARGIPFIGDEEGVHAFQVESCIVEPTQREGHAAIDGELLAFRAPLRYTLDRDALRVVMGQTSRLAT